MNELRSDIAAELAGRPVPSAILRAVEAWSLPEPLANALRVDLASWPDVAPAQLWRLSWRGEDALAVVLERTSWWARVAPITTDVALADEYTFLADGTSTVLGHPAAIFLRAAATVPLYTFAWYLGEVGGVTGIETRESLRKLEVACLQQQKSPEGVSTGPPLGVEDWDRLEVLDTLREQMSWFEAATEGVIDESGLIVGRDDMNSAGAVEASVLLSRSGKLRELVEKTGLQPDRLTDLKSGATPTSSEREALEKHFGTPVKQGHSDDKRFALLDVLSEPAHRADWAAWQAELDAVDAVAEDAFVPFMQHLLDAPIAARSVVLRAAQPVTDRSREEWRDFWRLALGRMPQE